MAVRLARLNPVAVADVPQETERAELQRAAAEDLGCDDERVGCMVEGRVGDRAISNGCVREGGVHPEDVLHEGEVGIVIRDVAEGDKADQQKRWRRRPSFWRRAGRAWFDCLSDRLGGVQTPVDRR